MSKICPETGEPVPYLQCLDCDDRHECIRRSVAERHDTLSDELRRIRVRNGETVSAMAVRAGASAIDFVHAECGNIPFPDEWLQNIIRSYGLDDETAKRLSELAERQKRK